MGMFNKAGTSTPTTATTGARPPMFGGFGGTKARAQGQYINPGTYIVEVEKLVALLSTRPGSKGNEIFVGEFTVLHTVVESPREMDPVTPGKVRYEASHKPGERVSYIQNVTKFEEMALGNIKALMLAIGQTDAPGLKETDISPEEWDEALREATAPPGTKCHGVRLICQATKWETGKGNWITACSFRPYFPEEAAPIAAV